MSEENKVTSYTVKRDTWHYRLVAGSRILHKVFELTKINRSGYSYEMGYELTYDQYKTGTPQTDAMLPRSTCDYANAILRSMLIIFFNLFPFMAMIFCYNLGSNLHPDYWNAIGKYAYGFGLVLIPLVAFTICTSRYGFGAVLAQFGYHFDKDSCGRINYE